MGDPFEYPDSELWKLRREQRAILRRLPRGIVDRIAPGPTPNLHGVNAALVELLVRETARDLLATVSESIAELERAADLRLRWTVKGRHYKRSDATTIFLESIDTPPTEQEILDLEAAAVDALNSAEGSELYDTVALIAWADRISEAYEREELVES
jgi:hypothetical protein